MDSLPYVVTSSVNVVGGISSEKKAVERERPFGAAVSAMAQSVTDEAFFWKKRSHSCDHMQSNTSPHAPTVPE